MYVLFRLLHSVVRCPDSISVPGLRFSFDFYYITAMAVADVVSLAK